MDYLSCAVALFNGHSIECCQVLSENGSAKTYDLWGNAPQVIGFKEKKPYSLRARGNSEQFIKTLLEKWAYVMLYGCGAARDELMRPACGFERLQVQA